METRRLKWGVRLIDHPTEELVIQVDIAKQKTHPPDIQFKFCGTIKPLRITDMAVWLDHARALIEVARKEANKLR